MAYEKIHDSNNDIVTCLNFVLYRETPLCLQVGESGLQPDVLACDAAAIKSIPRPLIHDFWQVAPETRNKPARWAMQLPRYLAEKYKLDYVAD